MAVGTNIVRQLAFDFFTHGEEAEKDTHSVDTLKSQPSIPDVLSQMHTQPIGDKKGFDLTPVFSYHLERAKRKTVGFIVDERGVTVRAPRWVSVAEIERMLQEKEGWIQKKLIEFGNWQKELGIQTVHFVDGAQLPYLGEPLKLRLEPAARSVFLSEGKTERELIVNAAKDTEEDRVKDWVQVWFKKEAERYLGGRIKVIADRALVSFSGWGLSSAKGRWGSCSSDRRIRLNWRLIHLAPTLIDYVIAHELAHLDEMNHSARFWKRVGEIYPDYENARRALKGVYMPTLPF